MTRLHQTLDETIKLAMSFTSIYIQNVWKLFLKNYLIKQTVIHITYKTICDFYFSLHKQRGISKQKK